MNQLVLDQIVNKVVTKKYIHGAVFYVSSPDNGLDLISASGNITEDSQYYIASINKLLVSSIILRLVRDEKLNFEDEISKYLPEEDIRGLHVYKGRDYSRELSVFHLLSQTSGLPCYLIDKQPDGRKAMAELEAGIDQPWPVEKVLKAVKNMQPHFPPGKKGKAKYIDTNHQILGLIIETVTGKPVNMVLHDLFQELNLTKTYVCGDEKNGNFVPIFYKSKKIHLPLFLNSTLNDIISTARDQMIFLKSFFNGHFFPKERLKELEIWNAVFFPFKYGIGLQQFHLPRALSPLQAVPDMIGHGGSTGSVAFYVPARNLYITGTVNQQARPNLAFQTIIRIIHKLHE